MSVTWNYKIRGEASKVVMECINSKESSNGMLHNTTKKKKVKYTYYIMMRYFNNLHLHWVHAPKLRLGFCTHAHSRHR